MRGKPCGVRRKQKRRGEKDWGRTGDSTRIEVEVDSGARRGCGTPCRAFLLSPRLEDENDRRLLGVGVAAADPPEP